MSSDIEKTVTQDQNGNAVSTGMYRYSAGGVEGFGATPQAAYLNWKTKIGKEVEQ